LQHPHNITTYNSDTFSMIGTLFLWLFWPSFNGATAPGSGQQRAVINTTISIVSSVGITFAVSTLFRGKFGMPEIQNSTLAGGVAMGCAGSMMIHPWGAIVIGLTAGVLSTLGFIYISPLFERTITLHDTAGIGNLHGIPGIIGGLAGVFAALDATPNNYGKNVGFVFPNMSTSNATLAAELGLPYTGQDRSPHAQAGYQMLTLLVTFGLAIASGLLTGGLLRLPFFDQPRRKDQFTDKTWFVEASPPSAESDSEGEKL